MTMTNRPEPTDKPLYRVLSADHARLDALIERALADSARIDQTAYDEFRAGLLRHIGMEEKVLLPAMQRLRGGEPWPGAAKLRLDHGALAALLMPRPRPAIVATLRMILAAHNELEEGPGGLYETADQLARSEADTLRDRLGAAPELRAMPPSDAPEAMNAARRAVARAGYRLDDTAIGTFPDD